MVAWDEPLAARFYFARVEESVTAHSNLATAAATWKSAKASTSDGTKPPTSQKYANTFNSVDTFDRRLAELAEYLPRDPSKDLDQSFRKLCYFVHIGLANFHSWFEERTYVSDSERVSFIDFLATLRPTFALYVTNLRQ